MTETGEYRVYRPGSMCGKRFFCRFSPLAPWTCASDDSGGNIVCSSCTNHKRHSYYVCVCANDIWQTG